MTIERIQTGLTRNYVSYWTLQQAIKEAAQNIAYGVMKSGIPARLEWINGIGYMEDAYIGFEKRHLYLGESEQRGDAEGLGNFGEGWKLFLLVCARDGVKHQVDTVGFSFHGEMVMTPHGVEVLTIVIEPNNRTRGTMVRIWCPEEEVFWSAIQSFGILSGIDRECLQNDCILPDRKGELWICGVRIEQGDDTNPLNLKYAYNLTDKSLMNRDRSQVNTFQTFGAIRRLIARADKDFIREYVKAAVDGDDHEDVRKGPTSISWDECNTWIKVLAEVHGVDDPKKLVLSCGDTRFDREAEYRGYTILRTPSSWDYILRYDLGIPHSDQVINIKPQLDVIDVKNLRELEWEHLKRAKKDARKALDLSSVNDLPEIVVVERIEMNNVTNALGMYSKEDGKIYLTREILLFQDETSRTLIHEAIHWQTGAADNTPEFTRGFENAILRLLGRKI